MATAVKAEETVLLTIDGAKYGDVVVNGHAEAGSVPITIYDLSYPVRTALGSGTSMDNDGNFAVSVSPELIEGHEIIAVDKEGRSSPPVVVTAPDSEAGPAP
jgi:hypothetical protein